MEQLLVVIFGEFDLLGQVVRSVPIYSTARSWLVDSVFLSTHAHNVFDSLLDDRSCQVIQAQDEFKKFTELDLRLRQNVFKAEKVNRLVGRLSKLYPVTEPSLVAMSARLLELKPVLPD